MKLRFVIPCFLFLSQLSYPEPQHGTVFYVEWWKSDLLTVAADSRSVIGKNGEHSDNRCKISAFGPTFVVTMAGYTESILTNGKTEWDAHAIARDIWVTESKAVRSASKLVPRVSEEWIARMEDIYRRPGILEEEREFLKGRTLLLGAVFAGTDDMGGMTARAVEIGFNLEALNSGKREFTLKQYDLLPDAWMSAGDDDVLREHRVPETERAKKYAALLVHKISTLPTNEQRATLATELIKQSVLLEQGADLGLPADVLQLNRNSGVVWVHRKCTCPAD